MAIEWLPLPSRMLPSKIWKNTHTAEPLQFPGFYNEYQPFSTKQKLRRCPSIGLMAAACHLWLISFMPLISGLSSGLTIRCQRSNKPHTVCILDFVFSCCVVLCGVLNTEDFSKKLSYVFGVVTNGVCPFPIFLVSLRFQLVFVRIFRGISRLET